MKSIIYKIKVIVIILVGVLASNQMQAQFDLGVVWQKNDYTTGDSEFVNIIKQADGTYLAVGAITHLGRRRGYIIQINEAGEKLREWILTPPNQGEWTDGGNTAVAQLLYAYITSSGDIMIFGTIYNEAATAILKGHSLSGVANHGYLKNGIWIVKINGSNNLVTINKLDRGNSSIKDVIEYKTDQYLLIGYDYQANPFNNFLFRVYTDDGLWNYDNYSSGKALDYQWAAKVYKLPNNNLIITSSFEIREYDGNTFDYIKTYATSLNWGEGCVKEPPITPSIPGQKWGPEISWSMKSDGGFWGGAGRMGGVYTNSWVIYGSVFFEKAPNNSLLQCNVIQDESTVQSKLYFPPYLLPGSTLNYVGTVRNHGLNRMFLCEDTALGGFTLTDGPAIPYNTSIKTTSHTDGFFSCGKDNITKRAAIAKLSTCVNFKIKESDLPANNVINKDHAPSININLPLNYEGAKAPVAANVKYDLQAYVESGTVNGITPLNNGGQLENLTNAAVKTYAGGIGKALDLDRTYTLADGPVVIKYILTIHDSYITAGNPQSCGQTYIFYLRSIPQSDVVAMPTIVKDGQGGATIKTSIKNIGLASFANPFHITVYKDAVGDVTKHTYTYSNVITRNETVDFEIAIPNFDALFAGATKIVVNFNDNGDGYRDQPERDEAVERDYEVTV